MSKKIKPAKGAFIITIPVNNLQKEKYKQYMNEMTISIKDALKRIEAAGWVVFLIPSKSIKEIKIELAKL